MDDAIACPVHADLIQLHRDHNHSVRQLLSDYRHALAVQVLLFVTDPHHPDWSEIQAANQTLQWVILTECHRKQEKS